MVRKYNEDALVCRDEAGLWAVADGMGGHQAGDLASQMVAKALQGVANAPTLSALLRATRQAIADANSQLIAMDDQFDATRVPGSTVATLIIRDDKAAAVWAGDSRIYRFREDETQQITRDHSYVQELVDQHLIDPAEAEHHPESNVITRAVGIEDTLDLDILHFEVLRDDRFLLCSDGLSKVLSLQEINAQLRSENLDEAVQSLLHTALVRGAPDNVTIIAVECADSEDETRITQVG